MTVLPIKAVRVRTSDGWQDIALGGPAGEAGPTGPGVAAGGSTGQVLTKTSSTDYATNWQTPAGGGGNPAADTAVWMPLYDSDGTLVLDSDEGLIPTLTPIG
jgi:hypothetical protein